MLKFLSLLLSFSLFFQSIPFSGAQEISPSELSEPTLQSVKKMFKRNPHRPQPVKVSEVKKWEPFGHRYAGGLDEKGNLLMVVDLAYPDIFSLKHFPRTVLSSIGIGDLHLYKPIELLGRDLAHRKEKFSLADLKLDGLSEKSLEAFHRTMKKAGLKENFLDLVQFEKQAEGGYNLVFQGGKHVGMPPKLIDFRAYKSSFKKALMILTGMTLLKSAVGSLPFKPFKNIISQFLDRWMMLFEVQYLGHHAQLIQLLDDAYHGDKDSPFSKLSKEELEKALRYTYNANTMWSAVIPKIMHGRKYPWLVKENLFQKKMKISQDWLKNHHIPHEAFHRYFAFWKDPDNQGINKKIVVLPHTQLFGKRPITAVDYQHPQKEICKRMVKEAAQHGLNYLDIAIPVPVVPTVVNILFGAFVSSEVMRKKNWEARLSAWMLNQEDIHGDARWEKELDLLYKRRLNPFELSREEEEQLIRDRQHLLKITESEKAALAPLQ